MLCTVPILVLVLSWSLYCNCMPGSGDTLDHSSEILRGNAKLATLAKLMVPVFWLKNPQKDGFMHKHGGTGFGANWRRRWFVLKDGKLYYYESIYDIQARGIVNLYGYTIHHSSDHHKKHGFKAVKKGARTYQFDADSNHDKLSWMKALNDAALTATSHSEDALDSDDD